MSLGVYMHGYPSKKPRRGRGAAIFLTAFICLYALWPLRNFFLFDRFIPGVTAGGAHIYVSLIVPNAKVAACFGNTVVELKDGHTIAGILKAEDETRIVILTPDKREIEVSLEHIAKRTRPFSAMPPMGAVLTPRELRDLVQFLSGLK